ncbi:MAG: phosphohistidine phosphatase SixA [Verrucomicrobiia bacterium]|jgi:phosphohistidine phosphatase
MKLYLVRHASASDIATSDAERELMREGREEARIVGAALAELGVKPASVLSSPLKRARQTAEIIAQELKFSGECEAHDELGNGSTTPSLLKALRPYASLGEIILVGHMPSLSEHLATLIGGGKAEGLALGKGGVACVELDQLRAGAGQLRWLMRQKQLRQICS